MTTSTPIVGRSVHGLTYAVLGWAVAYGGVRLAWTVGEAPEFGRLGLDLLGFTGWWSVALCAAAGGLAVALDRVATWRPALAGLAWTVAGALVAAAAILLPELVGFLLFTVGPFFDPRRSRVGSSVSAERPARSGHRALSAAHPGRLPSLLPDGPTGYAALGTRAVGALGAWAAVGGLVTRFAAQFVVGFDRVDQSASLLGLEIGLVLAGVLLPLALVHHWGEVWPGWVPLLAGRTIPRLLLLVPGFGLGAGIVAYFGMGMVQVSSGSHSEFSDAFLWVAMSAYLVMGLGLLVGSTDYHLRTRRQCGTCGR